MSELFNGMELCALGLVGSRIHTSGHTQPRVGCLEQSLLSSLCPSLVGTPMLRLTGSGVQMPASFCVTVWLLLFRVGGLVFLLWDLLGERRIGGGGVSLMLRLDGVISCFVQCWVWLWSLLRLMVWWDVFCLWKLFISCGAGLVIITVESAGDTEENCCFCLLGLAVVSCCCCLGGSCLLLIWG